MTIDYESVLKRYMAEVLSWEGTTFVSSLSEGQFTPEEEAVLWAMSDEVREAELERNRKIREQALEAKITPTDTPFLRSITDKKG